MQAFANYPLFDEVSTSTIQGLMRAATFRCATEGETLMGAAVDQDQVVFLVRGSGRAVLPINDGLEFTPHVYLAPSHFGDLELLTKNRRTRFTVVALEPCLVASVPYVAMDGFLASDHSLCLAWLRSAADQQRAMIDNVKQSIHGGARARLVNVFFAFARAFGRPVDDEHVVIERALSYSLLANCAGMSRRGAIKTMAQLQEERCIARSEEGWILRQREMRRFLLPDHRGLAMRVTS
ncbi:MAG: Crp/Fnr family transcriptional regulator [Myxococcota bacterium]